MLPILTNKKTVVAIGKFDTFHLGHIELISTACKKAKEKNIFSLILFIGSHSPDIISEEESNGFVHSLGVDISLRQELDDDFRTLSAKSFVKDILISRLNCECVVVGENFRFSKNRSADASMLKSICEENGIECIIIKEIRLANSASEVCTVSSTYIRELISKGMMQDVITFLGRPYSITSNVTDGRHIGTTLGIPTANLILPKDKLVVPDGVYATRTHIDGITYLSVTNVGTNPTVGNKSDKTIETNVFNFDKDIYGKNITIDFYEHIRGEIKFVSLDKLKEQIKKDVNYVKNKYEA